MDETSEACDEWRRGSITANNKNDIRCEVWTAAERRGLPSCPIQLVERTRGFWCHAQRSVRLRVAQKRSSLAAVSARAGHIKHTQSKLEQAYNCVWIVNKSWVSVAKGLGVRTDSHYISYSVGLSEELEFNPQPTTLFKHWNRLQTSG